MQTIYLDISNRGVIPVIYAKQGDVGRKVEVILTNSGLPYEPEAGSAFSAWYSGASGVGNYTDIGDHSAFSVSGNKVTVELITQMLQNAGEGILCMVLSRANGDQIGLWNIRYVCEGIPGAGSEPAKDYYTAFSQAVEGLAYPDASLSVAGKAADAAAVGTALAGKAPAGYGLGGFGKYIDASVSLDNVTQFGSYYWTASSPINAPTEYCTMLVIPMPDHIFQIIMPFGKRGCIITRTMIGNDAIVEWVNPPMIPGVEYRTTERWDDKAVYTKLLPEVGATVGGGTMEIPLNCPDRLDRIAVDMSKSGIYVASGANNILHNAVVSIVTVSHTWDGYNVSVKVTTTGTVVDNNGISMCVKYTKKDA